MQEPRRRRRSSFSISVAAAASAVASTLALAALPACAPAWSYEPPSAAAGPAVARASARGLPGPAQTRLTVRGDVSHSNLVVELGIENAGATPLAVQPDALAVFDGRGRPLPRVFNTVWCRGREREPNVIVPPAHACFMTGYFRVSPGRDPLDRITVVQSGVSRRGARADVNVPLEKRD